MSVTTPLKIPDRFKSSGEGRRPSGLWPEMSRELLAEEVRMNPCSVSRILSGRTVPSTDNALRIATALGLGLEEFVGMVKEQRKKRAEGELAE